jgi:hypothetical protein
MMLHVARHTAAQAPVPSKLNPENPVSVPTMFSTITAVRVVPPRYDAAAHASAVDDVHEVLLHCTNSSSDAVGVGSLEAKLSPLMITNDFPFVSAAL